VQFLLHTIQFLTAVPNTWKLIFFFVREKILAKQLTIVHVPALDQWADILTKPLSASRFEVLRDKLNVKSVSPENSSP